MASDLRLYRCTSRYPLSRLAISNGVHMLPVLGFPSDFYSFTHSLLKNNNPFVWLNEIIIKRLLAHLQVLRHAHLTLPNSTGLVHGVIPAHKPWLRTSP